MGWLDRVFGRRAAASSGGAVGVAEPGLPAASLPRASSPDVFRSVAVPGEGASFFRKLLAYAGPGFMVAVGYMDPGNWATDLAGGSAYGYRLLSVVLLSGLMAMLLQALAARLGIATGRDLAQSCRDRFPASVNLVLWLLAEIGICACDMAELLGTALGLQLLFGLPLIWGLALGLLDVFAVLALQRFGFRGLEAAIAALVGLVTACLLVQVALAHPALGPVLAGFLPSAKLATDPRALYLAVGIVGATVMPHNLYLHSSVVQTRRYQLTADGRASAARLAGLDSGLALVLATAVNAAILILAAAAFHAKGLTAVSDLTEAHRLLTPLLGSAAAGLFALALLASGQNSAITATLAGQIVMDGFVNLRMSPWKRRLLTRLLAAGPAFVGVAIMGEAGVGRLLILTQVVLALQLPFAVGPLVAFTGDRSRMGPLANGAMTAVLAWASALLIVGLNLVLVFEFVRSG